MEIITKKMIDDKKSELTNLFLASEEIAFIKMYKTEYNKLSDMGLITNNKLSFTYAGKDVDIPIKYLNDWER